jgi:hypothetical protein
VRVQVPKQAWGERGPREDRTLTVEVENRQLKAQVR